MVELTTQDDHAVRAEREMSGWRLVEPGDWPADTVTLDGLASQLAGLDVQGRVEGDVDAADFGVGDDATPIRFSSGGVEHTLRLADARRSAPTPTHAPTAPPRSRGSRPGGPQALRKSLTDLRDRRVLEFDRAAVERIDVTWPEGRVEIVRDGDAWRLAAPVEERADRATVETLLSDLAFLSADGFVDEPLPPEESGLETPYLVVSLGMRGTPRPGCSASGEGGAASDWPWGAVRRSS